ncbi:metalloregulator ArsR/SmtB family transcription factor [Microbacterium sp. NPDC090218]
MSPHPVGPAAVHAIGPDAADTVAATMRALSDPLRLRMLSAIAGDPRGESCVHELADLAEVSQPTVSHHLKVLKDVEVLVSERRGTWVWYRINPARRRAVTALLDSFAPAAVTRVEGEDGDGSSPRVDVDERVTRLAGEFAAEFPLLDESIVIATVRESSAALVRSTETAGALLSRTERFARQRLSDLGRDRGTAAPQVLFVCVANAGRSQLAAALVHRLAGGRVVARSAGSHPADAIHPHVRPLLVEIDRDAAEELFPKPLTDDAVRAADVVITMGCGDVCPVLPGVRYEDWAVGDPALASREGIEAIRDDIDARVRMLVDELLHRPPLDQESP